MIAIKPSKHLFNEDIEAFSDSLFFRTLSSDDNFFITSVEKMFITDTRIIVFDSRKNSILIFSQRGTAIGKISQSDYDPLSFKVITDVAFDEKKQQIKIWDAKDRKIFTYSVDGKFIDGFSLNDMEKKGLGLEVNSNLLVFDRFNFSKDGKRIAVFDGQKHNFLNSYLEIPPVLVNFHLAPSHAFDVNQDSIFYLPMFDDNIYRVDRNGITPTFTIESPQANKIGQDFLKSKAMVNSKDYKERMLNTDYIFNIQNLHITNNIVHFVYSHNDPQRHNYGVFYSRGSGKVKQINVFTSKMYSKFVINSKVHAKWKDYLIFIVPALHNSSIPKEILKGFPKELTEDLSKRSNPILLFLRPRAF